MEGRDSSHDEVRDGVWAGFLDDRPRIRVAARGIFLRPGDGALLVVQDRDPARDLTFYYPPGGGMHYGERAEETLQREMLEELGCRVAGARLVGVLENHFTHRGIAGHEIVFVFAGELEDTRIMDRDRFDLDDGGGRLAAAWLPVKHFRSGENPDGPPLYPEGVLEIVLRCVREQGTTGAACRNTAP